MTDHNDGALVALTATLVVVVCKSSRETNQLPVFCVLCGSQRDDYDGKLNGKRYCNGARLEHHTRADMYSFHDVSILRKGLTGVVLWAVLLGDGHEGEDDGRVDQVAQALVAEHQHHRAPPEVLQALVAVGTLAGRAGCLRADPAPQAGCTNPQQQMGPCKGSCAQLSSPSLPELLARWAAKGCCQTLGVVSFPC